MTQVGPVEVIVASFPGSNFNGAIAPALRDVVDRGDINVIDLAFITKADDGSVAIVEMTDESEGEAAVLAQTFSGSLDLLSEDDLVGMAEALVPGSSAVAIVFEHAWARALAAAVSGSDGQVIFSERIPRDIVLAAIEVAQDPELSA